MYNNIMKLWQVSVFGEYRQVIEKDNKEYKPKRLNKKNRILKNKLKLLYELYEKLYEQQNIQLLEQREVILKEGLIVYPEDRQAEPIESAKMNVLNDIDKRIELAQNKIEKYEQLQFEFMKEFQKWQQ